MTDYLEFEAPVTLMLWGKNTYTIVIVPDQVVADLGKTRRVEGEILDHPINMALTKSPAAQGTFLYVSKALIKALDIVVGEPVPVRLKPADANKVELSADVEQALGVPGVAGAWQALTAGRQRALLHGIETAKRAETRARRIGALVAQLKGSP